MPMFPLGTVLLPSVFLPLHVFEPRYRAMTRTCLDGDREFGVVLIERGSDVGGGDVRTGVGTVAHILEAAELEDGRWMLATVGTRRIRVTSWLDDDPYPIADVEDWPDAGSQGEAGEIEAMYAGAQRALRRVLGLRAELGEPAAAATTALTDDAVLGSYQVSALSPFGPADHQRLLCTEGPIERLRLATDLLVEDASFLAQRLELE